MYNENYGVITDDFMLKDTVPRAKAQLTSGKKKAKKKGGNFKKGEFDTKIAVNKAILARKNVSKAAKDRARARLKKLLDMGKGKKKNVKKPMKPRKKKAKKAKKGGKLYAAATRLPLDTEAIEELEIPIDVMDQHIETLRRAGRLVGGKLVGVTNKKRKNAVLGAGKDREHDLKLLHILIKAANVKPLKAVAKYLKIRGYSNKDRDALRKLVMRSVM